MKKFISVCVVLVTMLTLVGCGAKFDIDASALENYSNENSGVFTNASSDYSEYEFLEGVYLAETDLVHVELWDFVSTDDASSWFSNNLKDVEKLSSSSSGSHTNKSGNYGLKSSDRYYRIMFSEDKAIYSYANDKETLDTALTGMGILK